MMQLRKRIIDRLCGLLLLLLCLPLVAVGFEVYWNVPSFMCHKYQLPFEQLYERWGIVQNRGDEFHGDRMAILYDPGAFPALLQDKDETTILVRNGGVPQEGELALHQRRFRDHLNELIPDENFSGLGVIDMESWRPVFRQNWASLQIYRNYSLQLEQDRRPGWSPQRIKEVAQRRFEDAAREFMRSTLQLAKSLRPRATWGYYAYPYCFNWSPSQQSNQCAPQVKRENDEMRWLWKASGALYPSVYLSKKLTPEQRIGMVRGRVQEAVRIAESMPSPTPKVLVYYWYKYQDHRDGFVEKRDLTSTLSEIVKRGADGLVLWGSSNDLDNQYKCESFARYLNNSLGPALTQLRSTTRLVRKSK